jgi:hypothetical protein
VRELDAEHGEQDEQAYECECSNEDEPGPSTLPERLPADASPEHRKSRSGGEAEDEYRREQDRALKRKIRQPDRHDDDRRDRDRCRQVPETHGASLSAGYPRRVATEANYVSGEDYIVEYLGCRFGFNSSDFEERVTAAAVKLGLVADNELDDDETADLVELVERDWIDSPRSGLGQYVVRHWERVSVIGGESLVYWLKKLVFRGAWLDHRVKEGLLEVAWDDAAADFGYRDPGGGRALLELAPVPSWHDVQFRG